MNKTLITIINALIAGLAGAALFFIAAFYLHWGGIGEDRSAVTFSPSAPQISQETSNDQSTAGVLGPQQVYQQSADSAVQIVSTFESGRTDIFHQGGGSEAIGSGFVVSPEGYILTNAHVITDDGTVAAIKASKVVVNFRNGKKADAAIVGFDLSSSDVAVLKVDPNGLDLVPAVLGDSDRVQVGEPVVAIGSPFGLYSSSITAGIVSATDRTVESPETGFVIQNAIQTDAAINSGNSGGPLFNMRAEVIGLNEQIATVSGGNEGVGFAVPINTAKRVMEQIILKGSVEYAWLGVIGQTVDEQVATELELPVKQGALVSDVTSEGPAQKAGLKSGDIIIKVDDKDIATMEDVTSLLADRKPGDKVKVTYLRDGETRDVDIELGKRPDRLR
jgi:S1-C subfamily serine protease